MLDTLGGEGLARQSLDDYQPRADQQGRPAGQTSKADQPDQMQGFSLILIGKPEH